MLTKETPQLGSVELIIGCMFSNKTMTMISRLERYYYAKRRCIIIKHAIDTRYDALIRNGGIMCNNGIEYTTIPVITVDRLSIVDISQYDAIGITEAQFFADLLIVDQWATHGKKVICDGLDADSNRENFGLIHTLIPKCEKVDKLNAVCMLCGDNAAFTMRTGASGADIVDIGGADKYQPVCRRCFFT